MSSAKSGSSRARDLGREPRAGRVAGGRAGRATSGAGPPPHLRRRELAEPRPRARTRRPRTAGRRPGSTKPRRCRAGWRRPGRRDPEELARPVDRPARVVDDVAVAEDEHPLGVDVAVAGGPAARRTCPSSRVAPERRPARRDPLVLLARTPPRSPPPARGRRTTGASSCCRRGRSGRGPRRPAGRRGGPRRCGGGRRGSRGRTACSRRARTWPARRRRAARSRSAAPDPLLLGVLVAGPAPGGRRGVVAHPVLRFLGLRHEDVRVLRQRGVQGRGAGLGRAHDEEVRCRGSSHGSSRGQIYRTTRLTCLPRPRISFRARAVLSP